MARFVVNFCRGAVAHSISFTFQAVLTTLEFANRLYLAPKTFLERVIDVGAEGVVIDCFRRSEK